MPRRRIIRSDTMSYDAPELFYGSVEDAGTPVQLNAEGLTYSIMIKNHKKTILHDICLRIAPGETVALMGASGAGKTTLLKVLAGDAGGICESSRTEDHLALRINGESMYDRRLKFNRDTDAMQWYKSVSKLVPQDDILLPSLTGRQTLEYHAELTMAKNASALEKAAQVDKVLKMMNLVKCAETAVGSVEKRGMSGGERKRLSMGMELLSNPKLLLLDEPTTGLDSKNAEDVCRVMSLLAQSGLAVVCSIHQPSYRVLKTFDRLVLLHDGRIVYNGRVDAMEGYFGALGVQVPEHENPMDHFVKVVQEADGRRKEFFKRKTAATERLASLQRSAGNAQAVDSANIDLGAPLLESGEQSTEDEESQTMGGSLGGLHLQGKRAPVTLASLEAEEAALPLDFSAEWKKVESVAFATRDRVHASLTGQDEKLSFASMVDTQHGSRAAKLKRSVRVGRSIIGAHSILGTSQTSPEKGEKTTQAAPAAAEPLGLLANVVQKYTEPEDVNLTIQADAELFAVARATGIDDGFVAESVLGAFWQKAAPRMPSKAEVAAHHKAHAIGFTRQTWLLFKRTMFDQLCDKKKFLGACIMKLSLGLLAGFCWLNQARPVTNTSIFPITGVLFQMVNNCVTMNLLQTILALPTDRALAQREHRNGAYSLVAYYTSTVFAAILVQVVQCFLLAVPPYFLVGLQYDYIKIGICVLTLSVLSSIGCALGLMVGAFSSDFKAAQQAVVPILVPLTLFSGYVIPYNSILEVFRPFYHVSFLQHAFAILRLNEFTGRQIEDCDPLIPEPYNYCTGEEYLRSDQVNLDPEVHSIWPKMYLLLGELLLISVVGYVMLRIKFSIKNC